MARPFQYSLKTIFILILLAAAFFSGMAVQRRETERVLKIAEQERNKAMDAMMTERAARAMAEAERARAEEEPTRARAGSDDGQP